MSKSKKKKAASTGAVKSATKLPTPATDSEIAQPEAQPKGHLMVRAIRVTPALLDAAKAYKKASGKSFYALGLEAITERLVREGFLKESPESKS